MQKRRAVIDDIVEQHSKYCSTFTFKLQKGIPGQAIHKEGFINCYWSKDYKLVYMHIDKCGSTSVTTAFDTQCQYFIPLDKLPRAKDPDFLAKYFVESDHKFFAITRDPVSRWISGLNEFMCRYKPPIEWVVKQVQNKKYIYDEHTAPQKNFLRLCFENNGNLTLIKLDNNLNEKINSFIKNNISEELQIRYKSLQIPHLRNSKYFMPNYTAICKKIYQEYVETNLTEFKTLYQDDFEMYENGI